MLTTVGWLSVTIPGYYSIIDCILHAVPFVLMTYLFYNQKFYNLLIQLFTPSEK